MPSDPFKPVVISLPQLTPSLSVEVLPKGLTFHRIYVQADGKTHDILIGPEDPSDYGKPSHKYKNTIIGRYTNRVPVGTYKLVHPEDHSVISSLTTISNESPKVSLHGGPKAFDEVIFNQLDSPDKLTLFSAAEKSVISKGEIQAFALFKHVSPDGDQGYPGEMTVEVLIGLTSTPSVQSGANEVDLGHLIVVYRAKVSGKEGTRIVSPINLTQHWGFNLDASLRDGREPTIKDHRIDIAAGHIIELAPDFLATGKLTPTTRTAHEHKLDRGTLGERYGETGFDHFYLFSPPPNPKNLDPARVSLRSLDDSKFDLLSPLVSSDERNPPFVTLESPKSGLKVAFDTNQSGVQFWSCNPFNGAGAIKKIHGGTGEEDGSKNGYKSAAGAFLEFHEPHAAFLYPEFVAKSISKNDTLLGDDHLSHNFIKLNLRARN